MNTQQTQHDNQPTNKRNDKTNSVQDSVDKRYNEDEVDKLMKFAWYKNRPSYLTKLKNKPKSIWVYGSQLPQGLIDKYHENYNAQGRKRKRPITKSKFFTKPQSQNAPAQNIANVSLVSTQKDKGISVAPGISLQHVTFRGPELYLQLTDHKTTEWVHVKEVTKQIYDTTCSILQTAFDKCYDFHCEQHQDTRKTAEIGPHAFITQMKVVNGQLQFHVIRREDSRRIWASSVECVPAQLAHFKRKVNSI